MENFRKKCGDILNIVRRFIQKSLIFVGMAVMMLILTLNIPIFSISNQPIDGVKNMNSNKTDSICVLKYTYTTGPGWIVNDTNNDSLIGENVCLYNMFDPRLLKDNSEFDLDYQSQLMVLVDKIDKVVMDNEEVYVIKPKDITILYDTNKEEYRLKDMSLGGIIKFFISIVNKKYRYSY